MAEVSRPNSPRRPSQAAPSPDEACNVCVAVVIRPLIDIEYAQGCQMCLEVPCGQQARRAARDLRHLRATTTTAAHARIRPPPRPGQPPYTPVHAPPEDPTTAPGRTRPKWRAARMSNAHARPRLQVQAGPSSFSYDHVFGACGALPFTSVYPTTVRPLVESMFKGCEDGAT